MLQKTPIFNTKDNKIHVIIRIKKSNDLVRTNLNQDGKHSIDQKNAKNVIKKFHIAENICIQKKYLPTYLSLNGNLKHSEIRELSESSPAC
jgi:hypothetical protein